MSVLVKTLVSVLVKTLVSVLVKTLVSLLVKTLVSVLVWRILLKTTMLISRLTVTVYNNEKSQSKSSSFGQRQAHSGCLGNFLITGLSASR